MGPKKWITSGSNLKFNPSFQKMTSMTNTTFTFCLLLTGMLLFSGCSSENTSTDVSLETKTDSVSYSLGYQNGQLLKQRNMTDINPEMLKAGLQTALNEEEAQLADSEIQRIIQEYQKEARLKTHQKNLEEAEANKKKGDEFLADNREKEGIQVTDSGLQYRVLEEGSGASPDSTDEVRVDYEGTLIDGTTFDSREGISFPLNRVIPGWTEGLQLMQEGARYKFFIPGELAYGENPPQQSPIGPNETLIFDITLHEVNPEDGQ